MEEYIRCGKDKNIVDPDPNELYTKRKRRRSDSLASADQSHTDDEGVKTVTYPENGCSTSLGKLPLFTRAEMNEHIARSGKNIASKEHHSVPTSLHKAKTFLKDEYLQEIMATSDQECFYFRAKCCHSFRKYDPPHQLRLALGLVKGDVLHSSCSCVSGKVGFCNHISALMLKICKFSLFEAKTTKDLCEKRMRILNFLAHHNCKGGIKRLVGKLNIIPQPE